VLVAAPELTAEEASSKEGYMNLRTVCSAIAHGLLHQSDSPLPLQDAFKINDLVNIWRAEADETENYIYAIAL